MISLSGESPVLMAVVRFCPVVVVVVVEETNQSPTAADRVDSSSSLGRLELGLETGSRVEKQGWGGKMTRRPTSSGRSLTSNCLARKLWAAVKTRAGGSEVRQICLNWR